MTQIERILKDGIVDESFLKEEVICDYKVSTELKKLQAVNLDLLTQFDRICKENGLKYYLGFGTLLGAVRHKGFIPWDDDIDLLMPRHDYDIFIKMYDAFKHPYFLQTPESDPGYLYSLTKIRNSETCCIFPMRAGFGFNSGIWIDVFPLDKCMKEDRDEIFRKIDELNSFNSAYMKIPNQALNTKGKRLLKKYLDLSPRQSLDRITELSTKYKSQETPYLTDYSTTLYNWRRTLWNADDFKNIIELDFCGRKFPAPQGYDSILKITYGDYMKLPPIEKRGVWHSGHIISTEKPYKEFFDELGIEEL